MSFIGEFSVTSSCGLHFPFYIATALTVIILIDAARLFEFECFTDI